MGFLGSLGRSVSRGFKDAVKHDPLGSAIVNTGLKYDPLGRKIVGYDPVLSGIAEGAGAIPPKMDDGTVASSPQTPTKKSMPAPEGPVQRANAGAVQQSASAVDLLGAPDDEEVPGRRRSASRALLG